MGQIANKQRIQTTVIAYELFQDFGFCRKELSVDNDPLLDPPIEIGTVLISLDRGATFLQLDSAAIDTAGEVDILCDALGDINQLAIVIDPKAGVDPSLIEVSDTAPVLTLIHGPCAVKREALVYTGTINDANTTLLVRLIDCLMENVNVEQSQVLIEDFTDNVST